MNKKQRELKLAMPMLLGQFVDIDIGNGFEERFSNLFLESFTGTYLVFSTEVFYKRGKMVHSNNIVGIRPSKNK